MQRAYRGGGGGTTHDASDRKEAPTFNITPIVRVVRERGAGVSPTQGKGQGTVVTELDNKQPDLYIVRTSTSTR